MFNENTFNSENSNLQGLERSQTISHKTGSLVQPLSKIVYVHIISFQFLCPCLRVSVSTSESSF